jgi:hypothetical protein
LAESLETNPPILERANPLRVRLLAQAEKEAHQAALWYEERKDGLGLEFLDSLDQALDAIEGNPGQFPRAEFLRTRKNIRRCILKRFPFSIVYQIQPTRVLVLAVAHFRRRPHYWKKRAW